MTTITESDVEQSALGWLERLGWRIVRGFDIAPGTLTAKRFDYGQVVLERRLRDALAPLNPDIPSAARDDAFRKLIRAEGATLEIRNRSFHRMIVDWVTVIHRVDNGGIRGLQVRVVDFDNLANNDWLAVNQFTLVENKHERRLDLVLFVNGLPLCLIELKNPSVEKATIWTAWQQFQTYKFAMNTSQVVSDEVEARVGTLTAGREWFKPWRTISGERLAAAHLPQLQMMLEGICEPRRILSLVRDFIVFDDDDSGMLAKKMAGYHLFYAVEVAVAETLRAAELQHLVVD